jgi:hypothetical protein
MAAKRAEIVCWLSPVGGRMAVADGAAPLSYRRPAAFCSAFFCRRGRRDLFFGGSFAIFTDFADGLASANEASPPETIAADSFVSVISFRFAKCANLHSNVACLHVPERSPPRGAPSPDLGSVRRGAVRVQSSTAVGCNRFRDLRALLLCVEPDESQASFFVHVFIYSSPYCFRFGACTFASLRSPP